MITFVYPFIKSSSGWDELRYSIRSLEKHFQDEFQVVIIGDRPDWISDQVIFIEKKREVVQYATKVYDSISKLKAICESELVSDTFVWMNDDIYLIKDMSLAAMDHYFIVNRYNELPTARSLHGKLIRATLDRLKQDQFNHHNCSTHMPFVHRKGATLNILQKFDAQRNRYLPSSLVNNVHYGGLGLSPIRLTKEDPFKAGFYGMEDGFSFGPSPVERILEIMDRNMFLNHNNQGLTDELKQVIRLTFSAPSKFEK